MKDSKWRNEHIFFLNLTNIAETWFEDNFWVIEQKYDVK